MPEMDLIPVSNKQFQTDFNSKIPMVELLLPHRSAGRNQFFLKRVCVRMVLPGLVSFTIKTLMICWLGRFLIVLDQDYIMNFVQVVDGIFY